MLQIKLDFAASPSIAPLWAKRAGAAGLEASRSFRILSAIALGVALMWRRQLSFVPTHNVYKTQLANDEA